MRREEIKKIAEEYAKELFLEDYTLMQKGECDFETTEAIDDCISAFEFHIRYLSERFYIVEKSKVEKKYKRYVEYGKTANNDCGKCFREIVCKQIFEPLFGSEIGKEEENA